MPRKGWHGSKWIRVELRWAIYFRDHLQCVWCGKECGAETLDHLIPGDRSAARPHHLVSACLSCNSKRKRMGAGAWIRSLANREDVLSRLDRRLLPFDRKNALARKELLLSGQLDSTSWNFGAMSKTDTDIPF